MVRLLPWIAVVALGVLALHAFWEAERGPEAGDHAADAKTHRGSETRGAELTGRGVATPVPTPDAPDAPDAPEAPVALVRGPAIDTATTRSRVVAVRVEGELPSDARAEVRVLDRQGMPVAVGEIPTAEDVDLPPLAWGEYAIVAKRGEDLGTRPASWDGVTVIPLRAGRRVRGTVRVTEGPPLAGVTVHLHPKPLSPWSSELGPASGPPLAVTDEAGLFECVIPRLDDGAPTWLVFRHPIRWGCFRAIPPGSGSVDIDVSLGWRGAVSVMLHVVGSDAQEIVPSIRCSEEAELGIPPRPTSSRFELMWPEGRRPPSFFVSAAGYATVEIERPADPSRVLDVVLPKVDWRDVQVRDTSGRAIPYAEVALLELEKWGLEWAHTAFSDGLGELRLPPSPNTGYLLVRCRGFAASIVRAEPKQREFFVAMAEDDPPLLVLPADLTPSGDLDVRFLTPEGHVAWEYGYTLDAYETRLPGIPRGPKRGVVRMAGIRYRHEFEFDAEKRLEVPYPPEWPGAADVTIRIEGGGDLSGLPAKLLELGEKEQDLGRRAVIDAAVRTRVVRGRSYALTLPLVDAALRFPFEVPSSTEAFELVWTLPPETPTYARWRPRIVDAKTGQPLGGGTIDVWDIGAYDEATHQRHARIDAGRADVSIALDRRQKVLVKATGYAPAKLPSQLGKALLDLPAIEVARPCHLQLVWDVEPSERVQVFAFDRRVLRQPAKVNLMPRPGRGTTLDLVLEVGSQQVVWASGSRWAAPMLIDADARRVEFPLQAPAGVDVLLPPRVGDGSAVRVWLEYPEAHVGYSPRGRWRVLPYAEILAAPAMPRSGALVASIPACPAGPCTLVVRLDAEHVEEHALVLAPGEVREVTIP